MLCFSPMFLSGRFTHTANAHGMLIISMHLQLYQLSSCTICFMGTLNAQGCF